MTDIADDGTGQQQPAASESESAPAATTSTSALPAAAGTNKSSAAAAALLSASVHSASSGGLFDEVDAEEEAKAKAAAEAEAQAQEQARAEAARLKQKQEQEAAAAAAAQAQMQAQMQMQNSVVGTVPSTGFYRSEPPPMAQYGQQMSMQQPQQQQPQYGNVPQQPQQQPQQMMAGMGASTMYSTSGQLQQSNMNHAMQYSNLQSQQPQTPQQVAQQQGGVPGAGQPQMMMQQQQPQMQQQQPQMQQQSPYGQVATSTAGVGGVANGMMQPQQQQQPYTPLGHHATNIPRRSSSPPSWPVCTADPTPPSAASPARSPVRSALPPTPHRPTCPVPPRLRRCMGTSRVRTPSSSRMPDSSPDRPTGPMPLASATSIPPMRPTTAVVATVPTATPPSSTGRPPPATTVRRRFRHFVALEERLREMCPGAILPPRPEKHAGRAIEEASTRQSTQFALQRAQELENYLNALVQHPVAGQSPVLRLFLTLQDDIGTAWPEVSSSALTRLGAVAGSTTAKVAEGTTSLLEDIQKDNLAAGEDNAELLALAANEGVRMGSCIQAVPKMEGAIALLREQGERAAITGMEVSKLGKDLATTDPAMSGLFDMLSSGLLRNGRRTKRLAIELCAANSPFVAQYRLCRYERMAFADRRAALKRRLAMRGRANKQAQTLMMQQHQAAVNMGRPDQLGRYEVQTAMADEYAVSAVREADIVGATLQSEVSRIASTRLVEWSASIKVLASSMKEACAERASIWEGVKEQFRVYRFGHLSATKVGVGRIEYR